MKVVVTKSAAINTTFFDEPTPARPVADEFVALSKTCSTCHDVYLRGADIPATRRGGSP